MPNYVTFSLGKGQVGKDKGRIDQRYQRLQISGDYVADFNTRNKLLTQKLLKQGYRYHKLRIDGRGLMLWLFVGPTGVYLLDFFCSGIQFNLLLSPYPCFISLLYLDLYVLEDDALIS